MSADVDLAEAILSRWTASAYLTREVPGGLQCDVLTGDQDDDLAFEPKARPYAKLDITQERPADHSSGGSRVEYLKATVSVYGTGRKALGYVVKQIRGLIETNATSWRLENTEAVMAVYPQGGMGMVKEEQTKSGEKLLKATIPWVFWLHRTAY